MSNTEKIGRIHWSVTFTLNPGEARVRQDVRIANETAVESRYLYWANCGIPLKENTEYIYPETKGAMHGKYETVFSWPTYEGANLALIKNLEEMLGLYMLEAREGFFGYFSHDDKAGLAHYADVNDLPGKKYWSWGWHEEAQHTKLTHTDGVPYGEVQAGRVVIQEKFDRLPPLTSQVWTEFWYPVGDIGVFNGASENAAVCSRSSEVADFGGCPDQHPGRGSRRSPSSSERRRGIEDHKEPGLSPEKPLTLTVEFTCPANDLDRVSLEIRRSRRPAGRRGLVEGQQAQAVRQLFDPRKAAAAEGRGLYRRGHLRQSQSVLADWFYHLPPQKKLLEECLRTDPAFSRAHTELGLLAFQAGRFEDALAHFDKALVRVPDDGRSLYYKGLALRYLDRTEDAHYYLRHAGRFGYEAPERLAEAEMAIARGDLGRRTDIWRARSP